VACVTSCFSEMPFHESFAQGYASLNVHYTKDMKEVIRITEMEVLVTFSFCLLL
jgi:hypothetical protein